MVVNFNILAAGTSIIMTNSAPAPYPGQPGADAVPWVMRFNVVGDSGPVIRMRPAGRMQWCLLTRWPQALALLPQLSNDAVPRDPANAVRQRTFTLQAPSSPARRSAVSFVHGQLGADGARAGRRRPARAASSRGGASTGRPSTT